MDDVTMRVADYLALVNDVLRSSIDAQTLWIEGEVSDYRISQEKWIYFDLKDEGVSAVLKCFMTVWQATTPIENGMRVRVQGVPKVYERFGSFTLNVATVEPVGEGALKRAYELLKKKLEAEGLFSAARKRPLPRFPERIGLITSRDAAAYGDFLRVVENRWGAATILFSHVHVQGREAVDDILSAFSSYNAMKAADRPDVIVLTRGGGGLEDLHAFNDERVARAVFQSVIPVVCGVGHERDESLCDFVADVRASTPSNAAERVVPRREDVDFEITMMTRHMDERFADHRREYTQAIEHAGRAVGLFLERQFLSWSRCVERLQAGGKAYFASMRARVEGCERLLKQVDPKRVLSRGYSIVTMNGSVVRSSAALEVGKQVGVQLAHGTFEAEVLLIEASANR